MGRGGEEKGAGREDEQQRGNGYALGQLGHTHGELVDFIYWFLTFLSGSFFVFVSPFTRSNNGKKKKKPYSSGCGPFRPAQSLQSTPGWPIVACGGASQSSHRQAGPAD